MSTESQQARGTIGSQLAVLRDRVGVEGGVVAQLLGADLSALDLVALMVDGVHFGEHCCIRRRADRAGPSQPRNDADREQLVRHGEIRRLAQDAR